MKKALVVFLVVLAATLSLSLIPFVREALAESLFLPNKFTIDTDSQSEVLAQTSSPTYQDINYDVQISGEVGIGTAPSSYKLEIATASGITNTRIGTTGGGRLYLGNRGYYIEDDLSGLDLGLVAPSLYTATTSAGPWRKICTDGDTTCVAGSSGGLPAGTSGQTLRHNGTSWIANSFLYNNGTTLGVGTTAPKGLLNLYSTGNSQLFLQNSTTGNALTDGLELSYGGTGAFLWNYENTPLMLGTNNAERLRIANNGFVGIGTTNPLHKLHLIQTLDGSVNNRTGYYFDYGARMENTITGNNPDWAGGSVLSLYGKVTASSPKWTDVEVLNLFGETTTASQETYNIKSRTKLVPGSNGYGVHVDDDNASTGGTSYGLYVNLDDPDTTKYGIYLANGNSLCLTGSGSPDCRNTWPSGGGITSCRICFRSNDGSGNSSTQCTGFVGKGQESWSPTTWHNVDNAAVYIQCQ